MLCLFVSCAWKIAGRDGGRRMRVYMSCGVVWGVGGGYVTMRSWA